MTKDELLKLLDSDTKVVSYNNGAVAFTLRRLKLKERNEILMGRKPGADDLGANLDLTKHVLSKCLADPPLTVEELGELPAAIVDDLAKHAMDFNGWTKEGQAALGDHFRPAPGVAV